MARAVVATAARRAHGVPFVLNDRPDLAFAVGADGVHLGQDDDRSRWHDASSALTPSSACRLTVRPTSRVPPGRTSPTSRRARWRRRRPSPAGPGPGSATSPRPAQIQSSCVRDRRGTPEKISALMAAGVRHFVVVRYLTQSPTLVERPACCVRRSIERRVVRGSPAGTLRPRGRRRRTPSPAARLDRLHRLECRR